MKRFRLIYSDKYDLNPGEHVFPAIKYKLIRRRLLETGFAGEEDFDSPEPAPDDDMLLVHDRGWLQRLKNGTLSYEEVIRLEIPYSRQMVQAFFHAAGGTRLAGESALRDGVGFNIGGGFHHAFPGHGEGFCAIHDVAVAIRSMQRDKRIVRAMVIDCDVHHGNGTAAIFAADESVSTISLHQYNNYPNEKPPSSIDIHLADGTGDAEYLAKLADVCRVAIPGFRPDIVFYIAGADPYMEDQLGGLALTMEGLKQRDRIVLESSLKLKIPVAITLAGGYAMRTEDTVTIHCNTAEAARETLADAPLSEQLAD
ncbi:MAG: histone deacetylase [Acidimicrobiia bacterium]|nr:histone deacetylase [Acidimicrobiia bacterium]